MEPRLYTEKIMLFGGPGTGKTEQLINIIRFLEPYEIPVYVIDLEDKFYGSIMGEEPSNLNLFVATDWDEFTSRLNEVEPKIDMASETRPWIMVDRADLLYPMVQNWFTQNKYKIDLGDKLIDANKSMKDRKTGEYKPSMFNPQFDQAEWQVINEQYSSKLARVLYKYKANVVLTAGVKPARSDVDSPFEVYGTVDVGPRGQKELPHQPSSVFYLTQRKEGRKIIWEITTAKDIKSRDYIQSERLSDFAIEYLLKYYTPE